MRIKICANGTARFADGKEQRVNDPCHAPAVPGHIHCNGCRHEQGGYTQPKVHTDVAP